MAGELGHLTIFYTSDPANRHLRNSVSKLDTKSTGYSERKLLDNFEVCFDLFHVLDIEKLLRRLVPLTDG